MPDQKRYKEGQLELTSKEPFKLPHHIGTEEQAEEEKEQPSCALLCDAKSAIF